MFFKKKEKTSRIVIRLNVVNSTRLLRFKGLYTYRSGKDISNSDVVSSLLEQKEAALEEEDAKIRAGKERAVGSFTMIIGLPYSGKTTYAHKIAADNPNAVIISAEDVSKELHAMESSDAVTAVMVTRTIEAIKHCNNVICDCEGLSASYRKRFLSFLEGLNIERYCVVMNTAAVFCEDRAAKGDISYLKSVENKRYYYPSYSEGWDMIRVITDGVGMFSAREDVLNTNGDVKWDLTCDRESPVGINTANPLKSDSVVNLPVSQQEADDRIDEMFASKKTVSSAPAVKNEVVADYEFDDEDQIPAFFENK